MVKLLLNTSWKQESGGALVTVLVMLTVLSLLVGTVMAVYVVQHRFIRRDVHRLQARYAAEAGLHRALVNLEKDVAWRAYQQPFGLEGGGTGRITVESFGAFVRVLSVARVGGEEITIRALIGETPPPAFARAVVLGDPYSGLSLAGRTRIAGDLLVGEMGLQESLFDGRPFTGSISGSVERVAVPVLPPFEDRMPQQAQEMFEVYLGGGAGLPSSSDSLLVLYSEGDLRFTTLDSARFGRPALIVATGDLVMDGRLSFQPGSRFLAGGVLHLRGEVKGYEGLFYGRRGVVVADGIRCAGQFFSDESVQVTGEAYLRYPSLLYVFGEAAGREQSARIEVSGRAIVDGTLLYPGEASAIDIDRGTVAVGPAATVRGGVYSTAWTELHGRVLGTVATYQFHFYESPTDYINWLKDAVIDVRGRPPHYLLPLGFSMRPRLEILTMEEERRERPNGPR